MAGGVQAGGMGESEDTAGFSYVTLPNLCEMQMRHRYIKGMIFQCLGKMLLPRSWVSSKSLMHKDIAHVSIHIRCWAE